MNYKRQLELWRKRREKIAALLAKGITRTEVARRLGISKQRLSQIENAK